MICMTVEGVLMKSVADQPIVLGKKLYRAFTATERLILISAEHTQKYLEDWLFMEGLGSHAEIQYPDEIVRQSTDSEIIHRIWQVNNLRKRGYDIELVIDADPEVCAALIKHGYSTMVFTQAAYAVPSWRPDYEGKVVPWNQLSREIGIQAAMRAADKRVEDR